MRFFALETDIDVIQKRYLSENEKVLHRTRYHALSFFFAIIRETIVTIVLFAIGIAGAFFGWPLFQMVAILFGIWFVFVFFTVLKAYLDWMYDLIIVTTDKLIVIDQTSFFKREVKPIHVENIGSVQSSTQYGDIFGFGIVNVFLKEGEGGQTIQLKFVPEAPKVTSLLADVLTRFQRN